MSDPNPTTSAPPESSEAAADTPPSTGQQEASTPSNDGGKPKAQKTPPPTRTLTTARIAYPRQFDTLRAFAIAAGQTGQAVTLGEVSPHANLSVNTLSMITNFFVTANLLTKVESNRYSPTEHAVEFERAYHWNKETAPHALMGALETTWFGQTIINRLKMRGTMTVQEATELLASEAQASPEYRPQIKLTLEWLITTGVVDRDGDTLKIARKVHFKPMQPPAPPKDVEKRAEQTPVVSKGPQVDESGAITLNVAINIGVKDLMAMTPDRISAFFQGLAAVVAAKGGLEDG